MIESLMNVTLTVYKLMRVGDGQGGWSKSYVYDSEVSGRVSQKSASEKTIAGSENVEISHIVYTLTPLDRGDVLEVDVTSGTLRLEVLAVRNPSLLGHHYEQDCIEIQIEEATV